MKLSSMFERCFSSTPDQSPLSILFLPNFFFFLHISSFLLGHPLPPCSGFPIPPPAITSLRPSPRAFSLFRSTVFPSTESPHVQGPDAAGCHHGAEVSVQFARDTCGSKHSPPPHHTCRGHCHLQPPICCQPMAQHGW